MSDTNRTKLAFIKESTFGTQETGSDLQLLRVTSDNLSRQANATRSGEIRSNRRLAGVRMTSQSVGGSIGFELSYGTFDEFLAAVLLAGNVKAQGTLTMDTLPTDGDTITIGSTVYRFKGTMAQANDIKIAAADLAATKASFVATINGTGTAGVDYYAGTTTPHTQVTAAAFVVNACVLTAINTGTLGNSIATTETFTAETNVFDAATLGTTRAGVGWSAPVTVSASTISAAAADNSYNDSGNGLGGLTANRWVYVSGFTTAANNGFRKIATVAAGKITVTGGTLVNEDAGDAVVITQGGRIVDGTTLSTWNFEREYDDLTNEYALFTGCAINGMSWEIPTEGMITGSFDIIGEDESSETSSGGSGYDAITTTDPMQTLDVNAVIENATAAGFLNWTLNVNNNLRLQREVPDGITGVGTGQSDMSGTFQIYFENSTMYDKWLDETASSFAICLRDLAGNGYVLDFPSVRFTTGDRNVAGPNGDVTANLGWTAYENSTESVQVTITRFAA